MNLKPEEIQTYQLAMAVADKIWDIVIKWDYFSKRPQPHRDQTE